MTMTSQSLSTLWRAVALGLADHLWQSTLVAIAAGLLTLVLRKHHARARYWIWFAASMKFLVPFSLLVNLGSRLARLRDGTDAAKPAFYFVIEEIGQPFSQAATPVASAQTFSVVPTNAMHMFPWIAAVWICGFLAVFLLWTVRWFRISAAIKSALPLSAGREVVALRRIERLGGIRRPIAFLMSRASLEPGVFGITRPALIWPEGISRRLEDSHLDAIIAHEVWHVRRRDNLAAALHMLVEAVFWFYPLVWWLGARLVDERERACDEEVVALGSDRQVYAESILKVCEFCLGSPLPCVSGVTGADLKKRMVHIMNDRILHNLGFARKLLLTVAATLAIAVPIMFGLLNATPGRAQSEAASSNLPAPVFSSVSVKPSQATATHPNQSKMMFSLTDGSFEARAATLQRLIQLAYHVQDSQISGGPDWVDTTKFDVEAKLDPGYVAAIHQQDSGHEKFDDQAALKALLADQFKLAAHSQAQVLQAYDLVVDTNGPKLQDAGASGMRMMRMEPGALMSSGTHIEFLAQQLSMRLGQPVVNKTGLKGTYAFNLHWTPEPTETARLNKGGEGEAAGPAPDPNGPSLVTALQDQLGLKLVPHTEPVQVLVIDHAEQPPEN